MRILLLGILLSLPAGLHAGEVDELIKLLDSKDSRVRFDATRSLKWMGPKAEPATDKLLLLLGDIEAPFEFPAIQYFGPRVKDAAAGALVQIGKPALPGLIAALHNQDESVRRKVIETLGDYGPIAIEAFPHLKKLLLTEKVQWVRWDAVAAISKLGEKPEIVIPFLNQLTDEEDKEIFRGIVLSCLHDADPSGKLAIPILIEELKNPDPDVLSHAIISLGEFGEKAYVATDELITLLSSDKMRWDSAYDFGFEVPVSGDALKTLAKIGPRANRAVPVLIRMTKNQKVPNIRILTTLVRISPSDDLKQIMFDSLRERLKHNDPEAAKAFGEIGSDDAITELIEVLTTDFDPNTNKFQCGATNALARQGSRAKAAVPLLHKFLKEHQATIEDDSYFMIYDRKLATVLALSEIGKDAKPALSELRKIADEKDDLWMSDAAGEAIWKIEKSP
jgi:HEAT repeat protein